MSALDPYHIAISELAPAFWICLLEQCAIVTNGEDLQQSNRQLSACAMVQA